ncbi:MAG: hypothetical protein D3917_07110 [Candidatus Electrothrix sp. AX5]|jgi:hypothetical protein|uniref:DUF5666 domain-containing protein n=1 Tax=Candidatus Electrothrix aarhusensis TaxID=1859131 RepID=A0A444IQZ9_9BACT|nr:hypothetical protein [Candidatus Electrothrix sp. AX5]RWX43319.1 hypothetical protein H206_02867 [Candidatus Electrothrix aarhusensis]
MYNQKLNNSVFRDQHCVFFLAISVMTLLLSLTFAQAVVAGPSKNITGIVKETPGIAWPIGTWMVEDNEIRVTEQTVIKGDQSKAHFGAKVTVKGDRVNGILVANEFEIRTDDDPTFAGR